MKEIIGNKGPAGGHGVMAAGNINLESGEDPELIANDLKNNFLVSLKGTHDVIVNPIIGNIDNG